MGEHADSEVIEVAQHRPRLGTPGKVRGNEYRVERHRGERIRHHSYGNRSRIHAADRDYAGREAAKRLPQDARAVRGGRRLVKNFHKPQSTAHASPSAIRPTPVSRGDARLDRATLVPVVST